MKIHGRKKNLLCFLHWPEPRIMTVGTFPSNIEKAIKLANSNILCNLIRRLASIALEIGKLASGCIAFDDASSRTLRPIYSANRIETHSSHLWSYRRNWNDQQLQYRHVPLSIANWINALLTTYACEKESISSSSKFDWVRCTESVNMNFPFFQSTYEKKSRVDLSTPICLHRRYSLSIYHWTTQIDYSNICYFSQARGQRTKKKRFQLIFKKYPKTIHTWKIVNKSKWWLNARRLFQY